MKMTSWAPPGCGAAHGSWICQHATPGHAGRHYAYYVRGAHLAVALWVDKESALELLRRVPGVVLRAPE